MIPNMEALGSLVQNMHAMLAHLFYLMMPVCILIAVVVGYLKSGSPDFPDIVKRCLVASLLLVSFPEVSSMIVSICDGIAGKIDNMQGLATFMQMAQQKSHEYATAKDVLLLKFDDLFIAVLSFLSFMILYASRYITIALYYFYFVLLSILSPLMILCYIFPKTAHITGNLYRGLIEVASYKILWAIISAMLASLSFGKMYEMDGSYASLIVINFVIAIALLFVPKIARSLISQGVTSTADAIGITAAAAALTLPTKLVTVKNAAAQAVSDTRSYAGQKIQSVRNTISRR